MANSIVHSQPQHQQAAATTINVTPLSTELAGGYNRSISTILPSIGTSISGIQPDPALWTSTTYGDAPSGYDGGIDIENLSEYPQMVLDGANSFEELLYLANRDWSTI